MTDRWYQRVASDDPITQGDIILDCPVICWSSEAPEVSENEVEQLRRLVECVRQDVIVMTQACDLEQCKVRNVIVCPHYTLDEYKEDWTKWMEAQGQNPSRKAWRRFCDHTESGHLWNLCMLNAGEADGLAMQHRLVDFHEVFSVPRGFLDRLVSAHAGGRLTLRSPYREHLSQAFARFFMRVGLPMNVDPAW